MVQDEAIELLLENEYPAILKQADVKVFGPGSLEKVISTTTPTFSFTVPLYPTVTLGDYRSIRMDYTPHVTTDDEVDQVVRNLRANYSTAEPVDRPAQEGDLVSVKVRGTLVNPAEGEEAEVIPEKSVQMIVGENDLEMDDWPYEGFSRELVGMSAGESKSVTHTYPDDYDDEKLHGKEVQISLAVENVKSLNLPAFNDEFAQSLGEFQTTEALLNSIRQNLETQSQRDYDTTYFNGLVDLIVKISEIHYPPQALEEEIDHVLHSFEHSLEDQKMDLPTYLKMLNKEKEAFIEEEVKPVAKRNLEKALVLDEIARSEGIKLDSEELQREVINSLQILGADPEFRKLRGTRAQNFTENLTMQTATRLLNRRVMDRLKAIATGQADFETPEPEDEIPEAIQGETPETLSAGEPAAEPVVNEPAEADNPVEKPEPKDE